MAKKKSTARGINGKPWYWWVTRYECGPMPTARRRGRWYLYRCYDKRGRLLYVGFTGNLPSRFRWHRHDRDWYQFVVRVEIVEFLDRDSAAIAESQVIMRELPLHNKLGSPFTDGWNELTAEELKLTPADYENDKLTR